MLTRRSRLPVHERWALSSAYVSAPGGSGPVGYIMPRYKCAPPNKQARQRTPPGFIEVSPGVFEGPLSRVGPGVYIGLVRVVLGTPDCEDESHSCDEMGCSSVEHVVSRETLHRTQPFGGLELWARTVSD